MISLSAPKSVKVSDVALSSIVFLAALLFAPDSLFGEMNADWLVGLVVLPATFVAGLISSWLFYRNHDSSEIDPFYIRAWWSLIGGLIALPVCFLFRPMAVNLAFIAFTIGLGPVLAFHLYHRNDASSFPR